ncbi:unnamed protein product [Blepharisma stoltei]|uniref:Large ribosomal subunit protein uL3m n=1 Tax=Blepharisma stoltei TaxID=1481888 RepID=A0AAU9IZQ1_9CILI|nr:unnamed protein product [Blepharisma stoltei]
MIIRISRCFGYYFKHESKSLYDLKPDFPPIVTNDQFKIAQFGGSSLSKRTGLLAIKQGMTYEWDKWGIRHALTVLLVDHCQVVQIKTKGNDGYNALQLGVGERSLQKVTKPLIGHYIKADVGPKKKLVESKVTDDCILPVGYEIMAKHFLPGQLVDIQGVTKGKGFQGGIKRWHFHRQPTSHGNTKSTRKIGSTGNRQWPSRTFPGKKMPGHLGNKNTTIWNLTIYKIDSARNLIYIKGSVPGNIGGVVRITDAFKDKKKQYRKLPFPTFVPDPNAKYPEVELMEPPKDDPMETFYLHDNAFPTINEEVEEAVAGADADEKE